MSKLVWFIQSQFTILQQCHWTSTQKGAQSSYEYRTCKDSCSHMKHSKCMHWISLIVTEYNANAFRAAQWNWYEQLNPNEIIHKYFIQCSMYFIWLNLTCYTEIDDDVTIWQHFCMTLEYLREYLMTLAVYLYHVVKEKRCPRHDKQTNYCSQEKKLCKNCNFWWQVNNVQYHQLRLQVNKRGNWVFGAFNRHAVMRAEQFMTPWHDMIHDISTTQQQQHLASVYSA